MRRRAAQLLWLALAVQAAWLLLNVLVRHQSPGLDPTGTVIALSVAGFALLHRRWRGAAVVVRIVMAVDFLLAVADRFGILGPPGGPGVSWGDFSHFVGYTHTVAVFLPRALAGPLAVLATITEGALGVALLLGVRLRLAALSCAALLSVYGVSMSISLPAAQQFHYNVFILAAAMLALATLRSPGTLTADRWLARRHELAQPPRGAGGVRRVVSAGPRVAPSQVLLPRRISSAVEQPPCKR